MEALQIPTPSEDDSDNVVTALETAAIFGAKGDAPEAVRWLKRAAESAGADGRDDRALSLARTAADLADQLSGIQESTGAPTSEGRERRLPKPPPRPMTSVRPPPPSSRHKEGDAEPIPLSRPSATPMPTSVKPKVETARPLQVGASGSLRPSYTPAPPKVVTSVRPSPPSQAPAPRLAKTSPAPKTPVKPPTVESSAGGSQAPAQASVPAAPSPPSSSPASASKPPAPRPSVAAASPNLAGAEASATPATAPAKAALDETKAPPARGERDADTTARPPSVTPRPEAATKAESSAATNAAAAATHEGSAAKSVAPAAPVLKPVTRSEPVRALGRRPAARVSVEPSSSSKRFYVLRVLEEGESVPEKGLEAFLVLTDPNARFPED